MCKTLREERLSVWKVHVPASHMKQPHSCLISVSLASFAFVAAMSPPHVCADPALNAGLIAYWPLDGHLDDVVGDHHGEARGTTPLEFVGLPGLGRAVELDGINRSAVASTLDDGTCKTLSPVASTAC